MSTPAELGLQVMPIPAKLAAEMVVREHYLHRRPPISFSFGLVPLEWFGDPLGVVTYGIPASRHLQLSASRQDPDAVLELNRLWVNDELGRNSESWFVSRTLKMLPPRIVVSYADTKHGHVGYIYRALGWNYGGWTDMERKSPRRDYVARAGLHSRESSRSGVIAKVPRAPKVRYWTVTGTKIERRELAAKCNWPVMDWHSDPPPAETHRPLVER